MAQFSVKIMRSTGSVLIENQQSTVSTSRERMSSVRPPKSCPAVKFASGQASELA
jgi:hypothetical protein